MASSERDEWAFWEAYAPRYERFFRHLDRAYGRMLEYIRAYCRPEMPLLDVGTGTGTVARRLVPNVSRVVAPDGLLAISIYCDSTSAFRRLLFWLMGLVGFGAAHQ